MNKEINVLKEYLNRLMYKNFVKEEKPKFLYHYTSINAANSILSNNQLWVSDAFKTNDENEIIYIKKVLYEECFKKENNPLLRDIIEIGFENIFEMMSKNTFLLCFSSIKNSRKLWKEYSKDDGVCIRFTPNNSLPIRDCLKDKIIRTFYDINDKIITVEFPKLLEYSHSVCYNKDIMKEKVLEYFALIEKTINMIHFNFEDSSDDKTKNNQEVFDFLNEVFTDLFLLSCICKENFWKEENEYRYLFILKNITHNIIHERVSEIHHKINFLKWDLMNDNIFNIDRIYAKNNDTLRKVKRDLKRVANNLKFKLLE
ncbi:MAG: DUF2971 domain-containing protein [Candidatus Muirbacterium halophilum]|nr:DUF2971 domain-containing protein [Candidatus Muirbacterium halophilum]